MLLQLKKMQTSEFPNIRYKLDEIDLNSLVGQEIKIEFTGKINCIQCGRKISSTFNQGYCFPCAQKLAKCDLCQVKPELCHYAKGTCREPEWGEKNCLIPHTIYLANTAGLKIGITRSYQKQTRWADQGAVEVLELADARERLESGLFEISATEFISDKTDWRKLICGKDVRIDLVTEAQALKEKLDPKWQNSFLRESRLHQLTYPVISYPEKALSFNEKKNNSISGKLTGIRGQYLLFPQVAINIRKYQGYEVGFEF